ncbi:MAG: hypothetical protein PWP07_1279 [Epulopiscium sp.]|nr:hypothetical protein [Candidatus Epulonipiscium sp.]
MDFTFNVYKILLKSFINAGYSFYSYCELLGGSKNINYKNSKNIIIRHDVEDKYDHALVMAKIEASFNLKGSYYFRIYPDDKNSMIISSIASLGHEIGYHYDDLSACKGDVNAALIRFLKNLNYLRQFGSVETITMEGAPLSRYDNKNLWSFPLTWELSEIITKYYNGFDNSSPSDPAFSENLKDGLLHYRLFGIKGEPYFDLDNEIFFYITDTGRRWDGFKFSVRDKMPGYQKWINQGHVYHSTYDIVKAVEENRFPKQLMITVHPQRWNNKLFPWLTEWIGQNIKNMFKFGLNKFSSNNK